VGVKFAKKMLGIKREIMLGVKWCGKIHKLKVKIKCANLICQG